MKVDLAQTAFDLSIHPSSKVAAVGCINGEVACYDYTTGKNLLVCSPHKQGVFAVNFTLDGKYILTGSSDESICILDSESGKMVRQNQEAHEAGISCMISIDHHCFGSADDETGIVRIWDIRAPKTAVRSYEYHEDYVSDMIYNVDKKRLVTASGDGSLGVFDIRKDKIIDQTYSSSHDYLSVSLAKNNDMIVCGTLDGTLEMFKWGIWGEYHDSIIATQLPIDAMAAITNDIICYGGGEEGIIYFQHIHPNRLMKSIQCFDDGFVMSLRANKDVLIASSDSATINIFSMDDLMLQIEQVDVDSENECNDVVVSSKNKKKPVASQKKKGNKIVVTETKRKSEEASGNVDKKVKKVILPHNAFADMD